MEQKQVVKTNLRMEKLAKLQIRLIVAIYWHSSKRRANGEECSDSAVACFSIYSPLFIW